MNLNHTLLLKVGSIIALSDATPTLTAIVGEEGWQTFLNTSKSGAYAYDKIGDDYLLVFLGDEPLDVKDVATALLECTDLSWLEVKL